MGVDNFFADPTRFPIAAFKFQSLSLTGNPTIDLSNGGVTKLALIGVDGITSGPPGGTLTFTGLDLLALGTVNGSINLTSDVSFQDLNELAMYARGAGSNLILDSPISNIGDLKLGAEGSIQLTNPGTMNVGQFDATAGDDLTLQIGGSLLLNGKVRLDAIVLPGTTVASGANLTLNVTGDYTNSSDTEFSRLQVTNQGHIGTGGNISVNIGGNLTATGPGSTTDFPAPGDVELLVQNTNAQIDNGGNLNLTVNGNVQVNGLIAYLQNYDETANPAGHIGTGGNIDIEIGGNLSANSYVDVFLNNRGGGMIDSGGNLTFNVGGALNVGPGPMSGSGYVEFVVSNRYDDSAGNTTASVIGSDVSLFMHAGSVNITLPPGPDTFFSTLIGNRGGTIDGNASVNFNVSHDANILCDADIDILNDGGPDVLTPFGGTIHGGASLQFSAANVTANSLLVDINDRDGGMIDLAATVTVDIAGDLTTSGDASFTILNQRALGFAGPNGGSIGGDATVNVTANNFSVGGSLDVEIRNRDNGIGSGTGGTIGGNAAINLNIANTVSSGSTAFFQIVNESDVAGSPGGFIGGDATMNVNLGDITSGPDVNSNALVAQIDSRGGSIGGNAIINFAASGNVDAQGNAFFQILNYDDGTSGPGSIGGNAAINVNAASVSTADAFFARIDNDTGSTIGGAANVSVNVAGNVAATGDLVADILNGASNIGADANITFHAGGNITSGVDTFFDVLGENGMIQLGSRVDVSAQDVSANGSLNVYIDSNNGDIGAAAAVSFLAHDTNSIGDTFFDVLNEGGTIGSSASVDVTANSISAGGILVADVRNEFGHIGTSADVALTVAGDIHSTGDTFVDILNNNAGSGAGTVGSDATVRLSAANITTGGNFNEYIDNSTGGHIGGAASVTLALSRRSHHQGDANFIIGNQGSSSESGGTIGSDALISLGASNISTGGRLDVEIDNEIGFDGAPRGTIGGTIGGNATIDVTAANITADSLLAQIDNTGGSIGANTEGGATINMNVSGTATVTNDATVAIYGSDGAVGGAAININGGNYNVGGTFLSYIDGDGTITFNNASAHADVLKAGVFGANGALNISGGTLSADSILKLYAPGSNGQLNFMSNVTLGGNSMKILAANSVTIFNNVVVTIGWPKSGRCLHQQRQLHRLRRQRHHHRHIRRRRRE